MKILVPLNGTPKSESVIPFATNLALRWQAEIVTVTVVDPVGGAGDPIVPLVTDEFYRENLAAGETYVQSMSTRFGAVSVQPFCRVGDPPHCIAQLAAEQHCDLILLGNHGHSGFLRWFFGSVAEAIVRHAPCPVLLVRHHMPLHFRQILVPVDGSEASLRAAREIPQAFFSPETRVTLLHCAAPEAPAQTIHWGSEDGRFHLTNCPTPAPQGIFDWLDSHDCDLICMSTHGREGIAHLWQGSITEEVSRTADCPVLVFPPQS